MKWFSVRRLAAAVALTALIVMTTVAVGTLVRGAGTATSAEASPSAVPVNVEPSPASSAPTISVPSMPEPAVADGLDGQLQRFVEAYFYIAPTDTPENRTQRVGTLGLVSAEAMQGLAFAPSDAEAEYQRLGITQHAGFDPRTVSATPSDEAGTTWQVSVPVSVFWTDDASNPIGEDEVWIGSTWVRNGDTWTMTAYSPEGGG